MEQLDTIPDVIKALGGQAQAARLLGCTPQAVYMWKRYGQIPSHTFLFLNARLKRAGFRANPQLWGMTPCEQ